MTAATVRRLYVTFMFTSDVLFVTRAIIKGDWVALTILLVIDIGVIWFAWDELQIRRTVTELAVWFITGSFPPVEDENKDEDDGDDEDDDDGDVIPIDHHIATVR